ncbi:MAG: Flp pilus assembly complex ATPase component TadA [Candidatus Hydrogenedentes bacterium]|nr:Flp pilus assembly complex ATPase component TadA [Candidatus Hydrogenedentota bacterium]
MVSSFTPELERLVRTALDADASDLHLIPGDPPTLRLRGKLERMDLEEVSAERTRELAAGLIGEENLARIGLELGEFQRSCGRPGEFNLSVAVARSRCGYTLAFRVMPPTIYGVKEMALPEAVVDAGFAAHGLIVFAGLTGSGKTTAMYGLLDHINAHLARHICTVESPAHLHVTPKMALIQQREVGQDVPTRLAGIQAAMAQDLDVLMVGEVTTVEELQACMTVAETGHLVLTQIHADSPEGTVYRILEVFPDELRPTARKTLAATLRAVCAQRLLPRADGHGRVAAYGVLIPDAEMRNAIASGADFMARKSPWSDCCQTMGEHIERLLDEHVISEATARQAMTAQ